jgi:energy-coupling factor transporter ATP-binding protein EcfA2
MIRTVTIENFKSIEKLELELGRVNVFIGENGSGKSNVLEAIAFASAASQDKLDNEFLASRGIRVTEPRFMRAAFGPEDATRAIRISVGGDGDFECRLRSQGTLSHVRWVDDARPRLPSQEEGLKHLTLEEMRARLLEVQLRAANLMFLPLREFIIYSPENTALRIFQAEGQILPLGIKGEGLFAHLKALTAENRDRITEITESLSLIDWFERFEIPSDLAPGERNLRIRDRYLTEGALFDQRSANEGFLFLLFYFTLFISPDTPEFFALDNVDASLNPKLCSALTEALVTLAKKRGRYAILTTHNPAVLDGLDLHDEEQRLFVVSRNKSGHTKVRRVPPPQPVEGEPPIRLSEAFLRGYIGGLPKNF